MVTSYMTLTTYMTDSSNIVWDLSSIKSVREIWMLLGMQDFLIKIDAASEDEFIRVHSKVRSIHGIEDTTTMYLKNKINNKGKAIDHILDPRLGGIQHTTNEFYFIQTEESQKHHVIRQFDKIKQVEEIWNLDGVYNIVIKTKIDLNYKKRYIFCPALKRTRGISEVFACAVIKYISLL